MFLSSLRKHLDFPKKVVKDLAKRKGLLLRGSLCLMAGTVALLFNDPLSFDLRFRLRNTNNPSKDIVVIYVSEEIQQSWPQVPMETLFSIKELRSYSDSYYWNPAFWEKLLNKVFSGNPKAVGVTLFFGQSQLVNPPAVFSHPRLIWSGKIDYEGRVLQPGFTQGHKTNIGLSSYPKEKDGTTRSFSSSLVQIPHLALQLSRFASPSSSYITGDTVLINFQGPKDSYQRIESRDLLNGKISPEQLKDKIIVIGSSSSEAHLLRTPLGEMSRSEITANVIDNIVNDKWIKRLPYFVYLMLLISLLVLCIYIVMLYPHSVSLVFFIWIGVSYLSISLWIFDTFYIWLPLFSPTVQISFTFLIFISYQLTIKDTENWKLEQEKKYLTEVEELKDNFVSLFSHDLKTPIAKIQAICDRVINESPDSPHKADLNLLRRESQELHRYIQSILQVTKVESKDFKLNRESFDVNELIESVVEQLTPLARLKGQFIHLELEPIFLVEIDGPLIREVLLNLVENAIKYSPNGASITIKTREEGENVYISVKDQGDGIPITEQKKIFEKFYRGDDQLNKTKGSGLGLYLAKYFIELHGGDIWVESSPQTGTKINFYLPVQEV